MLQKNMGFDKHQYLTRFHNLRPELENDPVIPSQDLQRIGQLLSDFEGTFEELIGSLADGPPWYPYVAVRVFRETFGVREENIVLTEEIVISEVENRIFYGNVTVGAAVKNAGRLVVVGDMAVQGAYSDEGNALLCVAGHLRVANIETTSEIVAYALTVSGILYGYYNDHSLLVSTILQARLIIEDDHYIKAAQVLADSRFDGSDAGEEEKLKLLLVPEVFSQEGILDRGLLFQRLEAGEKLFINEVSYRAR